MNEILIAYFNMDGFMSLEMCIFVFNVAKIITHSPVYNNGKDIALRYDGLLEKPRKKKVILE